MMSKFFLSHKGTHLLIDTDSEYEDAIKLHFKNAVEIDCCNTYEPSYTLVIHKKVSKPSGLHFTMVDEVFDNASMECWIDNIKKTCYISDFVATTEENRDLTIRFFCSNVFNRLLELHGYVGLHCSCVAKKGKGILFVGNRLSGKTTSMLTLIRDGFDLVNNDSAAIKYIPEEQQFDAFGIVDFVFIRMNNRFSSKPENSKYVEIAKKQNIEYCKEQGAIDKNRIMLTHFELAEINNAKLIPSTSISAVVFPVYDPNISESKMCILPDDKKQKYLKDQDADLVHYTTEFLRYIEHDDNDISDARKKMKQNLVKLPFYLVESNENTTESFVENINNILS